MSKNVISQSDELIKLRKHSKHLAFTFSFLAGLGVAVLWFIYVLLAVLGRGYYKSTASTITPLRNIPYPDTLPFLFDFSSKASILRLIILGAVILLAVLTGFIFYFLYYKKINRKYEDKYIELLKEECKINGLTFDNYDDNQKESFVDTLHLLNLDSPEYKSSIQFTTGTFSWVGRQFSYLRSSKKRDAFIASADLTKARSHAFIQLRTFGEPSIMQYEGLPVKKYGFGDDNGLTNFVCFTSLGQDIYFSIDKRASKAIAALYDFVKCDLIITVIGDKLTVMIDGFKLRLSQELKRPLPNQVLEQEAEALTALHQAINNLGVAFSGDLSFGEEEKGNGITSY